MIATLEEPKLHLLRMDQMHKVIKDKVIKVQGQLEIMELKSKIN